MSIHHITQTKRYFVLTAGFLLSACSEPQQLSQYSTEEIVTEYADRLNSIFENELQALNDSALKPTDLALERNTQGQKQMNDDLDLQKQKAADALEPFAAQGQPVAQHIVGSSLITGSDSDADKCAGLKLIHLSALAGYPLANVGMSMHYLGLSGTQAPSDENYKLAYFWAKEADRRNNGPTELVRDLFMLLDRSEIDRLDAAWAEWKPINSPIRIKSSNCN